MTQSKREIFISYAHGDESRAHAERLVKLLEEKGLKVVIDEKNVGYKDNIEDFEKRIGRGDCVITIISDKYLRSEHCMFEMVCIERRDEVYDRIFPIVLTDAHSIYNRSGRLNYQKYWTKERENFKKELDEIGPDAGMQSSIEDLNKLEQIKLIAGKINAMLAKMYTLEPEQHLRENYADLLAAIEKHMAGEEEIAATAANKFLTKTPGRPDYFIGREQQLQSIHKKLSEHDPLLLVNGLGGIGKTTLAQAYVNAEQFSANYQHIAWILAGSDLRQDFVNSLQIPLQIDLAQTIDLQQQFELILDQMQNRSGNNLLVIDNANNHQELLKHRQTLKSLRWKILLTSRCEPDAFSKLPVDELPPKDAKNLFLHHFVADPAEPPEKTDLPALLEQINHHTLLIELLAKAGRKKGLSIKQILERLQQTKHKHRDLQRKITVGNHAELSHKEKQAKLHDYILALFEPEKLGNNEQRILTFFAVLPPEEMPVQHLATLFAVAEENRNDFEDQLDDLQQNGWLSHKQQTYKMHPLLQDVVFEKLTPDAGNCADLIQALSAVLQAHLGTAFDYLTYAVAVANKINTADLQLGLLQGYLGETSKNIGNLSQALQSTENARKIFEQLEEKENLAISYSKLGDIQKALGQFDKALEFFELETDLFKELHQANPKSESIKNGLAISYSKLGGIHQALGQFDQALEFFELYNQSGKELHEANPKSVDLENNLAISFSDLAGIYLHNKQSGKAREYYQEAVQIWQRLHRVTGLATYKSNLETVQQELKNTE